MSLSNQVRQRSLSESDEIVYPNEVSSTNQDSPHDKDLQDEVSLVSQDSPHDKNLQDEVSLANQEAPSNKITCDEFTFHFALPISQSPRTDRGELSVEKTCGR